MESLSESSFNKQQQLSVDAAMSLDNKTSTAKPGELEELVSKSEGLDKDGEVIDQASIQPTIKHHAEDLGGPATTTVDDNEATTKDTVIFSSLRQSMSRQRERGDSVRSNSSNLDSLILPPTLSPISPSQSRSQPPSTQTSSSSLNALELRKSSASLNRQASSRSGPSQNRPRNLYRTHSKSASMSSHPHPGYPEQSHAALQLQSSARPHPPLRSSSSNPGHSGLHASMSRPNSARNASPIPLTVRTTGNTPTHTPGLFSPNFPRPPTSAPAEGSDSPRLHALQTTRETNKATIERDMFTGLKTINYYEVMREIGRGRQGKVKFARYLEYAHEDGREIYCAIKIVPRTSARRRLGRIAEPTTDVKREIAILKKARHPNIVALYEVIDDPDYQKVYLILEYVARGEIVWRTHAPDSIIKINNIRWNQEMSGKVLNLDVDEGDRFKVELDLRRHLDSSRRLEHGMGQRAAWDHYHEDTDEEFSDLSRNVSLSGMYRPHTPSRGNSGTEYDVQPGSVPESLHLNYSDDVLRNPRRASLAFSAVSHMSSEHEGLQVDEQEAYVPTLTLPKIRRSFRDVLLGLEFLHHIGIIHRDIKPANLLVSEFGEVKISDFGVSYLGKPLSEEEADTQVKKEEAGEEEAVGDDRELAKSVGTPAFWAPELCYDDTSIFADNAPPKITGALDLWSLGVTLYCMIYARLPFYGGYYGGESIGLHALICTSEPFLPATRLAPVEAKKLDEGSDESGKRSEYELKYEYVPESVRDLIRKLLVKDPSKRLTVRQAKAHPWVVEGLQDPSQFFQPPNLPAEGKAKLAKLAEPDLDKAVKTLSYAQKAVSNVKSAVGSIVKSFSGRRSRGTSATTSGSGSSESIAAPSSSSGSTVGRPDRSREGRRKSLKPDEMAHALKVSRDTIGEHHPLSQSETASPVQAETTSYFPDTSPMATASAATATPKAAFEARPPMAERAPSSISTAESIKTIRAPQPAQPPSILDHHDSTQTTLNEVSHAISSTLTSFWEGASAHLGRKKGRNRSSTRGGRSPSLSRDCSDSDVHAVAHVGVTTLNAAGNLETPERLRGELPQGKPLSRSQSTKISPAAKQFRIAPTSSDAAFQEANKINQRKQVYEIKHHDGEDRFRSPENEVQDECPPSPDDILFLKNVQGRGVNQQETTPISAHQDHIVGPIQTLPSASTIASTSTDDPFSYSSNVSQRISNPSLGFGSGASSPPVEQDYQSGKEHDPAHAPDHEGDYMRTVECMQTAEYIPTRGRQPAPVATGKPLEQQAIQDDADDDHLECDDDGYDESDDEDDDDVGIMMSNRITRR